MRSDKNVIYVNIFQKDCVFYMHNLFKTSVRRFYKVNILDGTVINTIHNNMYPIEDPTLLVGQNCKKKILFFSPECFSIIPTPTEHYKKTF